MARLSWDQVGEHKYEAGLDRGVLYPLDRNGVVWNGLVSVTEKTNSTTEPWYWDGRKFYDYVTQGDYAATLSALTYPEEFEEIEGAPEIGNGVSIYNQKPQRFGLSYRTKVGNDVQGISAGYRIHVLFNLLAVPVDLVHSSIGETTEAVSFQWELTSIPVEIPDFEPTAHIVIDTTKMPSELVTIVEDILYGTVSTAATLPPMSYFLDLALTELV